MKYNCMNKKIIFSLIFFLMLSLLGIPKAESATMQDYCVIPPFISQNVPPLVMLAMGRDHKVFYEAFNDAYDLDEDKRIDNGYKHSIDYYGYFDPYRCYVYNSTGTRRFVPQATPTTDKFCSSGQWSGNVLNYLTMSKMDVIRKVFYGGHRTSASSNVLERAYIPQDAHSWGKEFTGRLCYNSSGTPQYTNQCITDTQCDTGYTCTNKSLNLIGIAASSAPVQCTPNDVAKVCSGDGSTSCTTDTDCATAGGTCSLYTRAGQILLAKYNHASSKTASVDAVDHATLVASYEPTNIVGGSLAYVADFSATVLNPNQNHGADYNYFLMTQFEVTSANAGTWIFAIDSNEAAEIEIDGSVVVGWYGRHTYCNCQTHNGSVALAAGWHTLIVRHFENSDNGTTQQNRDGVRVRYDLPSSGTNWVYFGNTLNLRSPNIDPGGTGNYCSIMTSDFIQFGTPIPSTSPFTYGDAKYHLFCNTSLGDLASDAPLLRLVTDRDERIWQWASKERPVCNSPGTTGYPFGSTVPTDYEVRVESCTTTEAANKTDFFKNYCRDYPAGSGSGYMPAGLMQKYGEGDGTKVCSKQFTKTCNNDGDCNLATEGKCMERTKMFFGLITGSYTKNMSGGVLRKNVWSVLDEIESNNGSFQTSENTEGNLIDTLELMRTIDFNDGSGYDYTCGWITDGPMAEGECKMWGNPIAEIMYEATRYFADKGSPTADFMYPNNDDSGLLLSKLGTAVRPWIAPYSMYPDCARPFTLVFSDISPSFDSDQLPGSYFNPTFSSDLTTLDVSTLARTIGTQEGIAGTNRFIGESGTTEDFLCTSKSVSNLDSIRGLCPEEPTKEGSFYSASVAYYGKEKLKVCSNSLTTICTTDANCPSGGTCMRKNLTTYSVALSSPVPDINLKIGGKDVRFIPTGKSVTGCYNIHDTCNCTFTTDTNGLHISNCASGSFCPTNQIVDFYVDTITYDSSNNLTYAKFRINFEDVEQGADHDMDAIVTYEIEPDPDEPTSKVIVSLTSDYAAGCVGQAMGFIITGTSEDGVYLPVRDVDTATSDDHIGTLPLNWTKTFSVTGAGTEVLKDPLWYAAKWGGFEDSNGNGIPDVQAEWDTNSDGTPDNYFLVVNPLKMERQIEDAFLGILRRASSGTAASVLASGEGSGANIVQAIFYPKRAFGTKEVDWTATLQNLWYFIDPRLNLSTIRENTDKATLDMDLELDIDRIVHFYFDEVEQKTRAYLYASDASGNQGAMSDNVDLEEVRYLWEAGSLLHARDIGANPRTIYTTTDGVTRISFDTTNENALRNFLQASSQTEGENIINYIRGTSDISTTYRDRTVTNSGTTAIWRLGDIINSTPRIASWIPLHNFHATYNDTTYNTYISSSTYTNRGRVYTGANDGMLHAFKLGTLQLWNDGSSKKATLAGSDLGKEEWAFIPKSVLPYLKYLMDKDYCHLYYIDATPVIFDASIGAPGLGDISDTAKAADGSSWRTILIGGMRIGGACKAMNATCSTDTPNSVCAPTQVSGNDVGYSSYFALDITDESNPPVLLWEFNDTNISDTTQRGFGFSTSGPAVVRINARTVAGSVSTADRNKNGKYYVVFASGPTGPIDQSAHQFKAYSDQPLKLFVVDLKTGAHMKTIDTFDGDAIPYAFGGYLNNATIDYDLDYQDDALYVGYTSSEDTIPDADTRWTQGGVIRLITREDLAGTNTSSTGDTALNPGNWRASYVARNIGSVTSSIAHLAHYPRNLTTPNKAYLYFGSGRYFYKSGEIDNASVQRSLFGVKELCLETLMDITTTSDPVCDSSHMVADNGFGSLGDANSGPTDDPDGWHIELYAPTGGIAERVITDTLGTSVGAVFFTTYTPSTDVCEYGGSTYLWAVRYDTGGSVGGLLKGVALMQVSTGSIEEVNLATAFTDREGRRSSAMKGAPPLGQGLSIVTNPIPIKRQIHMMER